MSCSFWYLTIIVSQDSINFHKVGFNSTKARIFKSFTFLYGTILFLLFIKENVATKRWTVVQTALRLGTYAALGIVNYKLIK